MARTEFEYPIPVSDAEELMEIGTGLVIAKRRHFVPVGGDREGLILAEVELPSQSPFHSKRGRAKNSRASLLSPKSFSAQAPAPASCILPIVISSSVKPS